MAVITIEIGSATEQSLKLTAAKTDMSFECYVVRLIEEAGHHLDIEAAAHDEENHADERPWRGLFTPARPRRNLLALESFARDIAIPKRSPRANMNWHRIESDDE